jgi:hypothetical protein
MDIEKKSIKEIANIIIRGEKTLVFPLQIHSGWISDQQGHHILDLRGWGFIQYADDDKGAEIQDAIGEWVIKTLNDSFIINKE